MDEADPPRLLYRIGRAPDPISWPPAGVPGRYNDPEGQFRVLYGASERRAAFLETLQDYRPALHDLALVASLLLPGDIDLPGPIGRVPRDYFAKRIAAFQIDRAQRWLDVRSPQTHAHLRAALAADLVTAGYSGSFNFGEIIGSDYRITRIIARWTYDAGYAAIAYPCAHDDRLTCWAVFDSTEVTRVGIPEPIQRDDPDLIAAVRLFGLALPD